MTRSVRKTIRTIAKVQNDGGDAGCYAELHGLFRSTATKISMMEGFIGEHEARRRLKEISRMAKSLPWLHSEKVISRRLKELDALLKM